MTIDEKRSTCVYFDGSCPICSREIAFYKRKSIHKSFKWVDVANVETAGLFPQGHRLFCGITSCETAIARLL